MKTFLLLATMLITTSAFAIPKIFSSKKYDESNSQPNNVLVINIDQLRNKTKDVSLLKPLFMIVSAVESVTEKLHGRKLKITCNKNAFKHD